MSPEQAAAKIDEIDHRSDQWSLACIAWHMLVGQQPFVGPDVNSILHQVMNGEPPRLGPGLVGFLPGQVESVLRRALSKRQIDRFPTITAFAKAFEAAAPIDSPMRPVVRAAPPASKGAALAPSPGASSTARPSGRRWAWLVVALLAFATGAGIAVLRSGQLPWLRPEHEVDPAAESSRGATIEPLRARAPGGKASEPKRHRASPDRPSSDRPSSDRPSSDRPSSDRPDR
jgi:serine/threonine-protein kinase